MTTDALIHFDPANHTYTYNGTVVPSVTQVLESVGLVSFGRINEYVLDQAARRGSAVHQACHYDDLGDLDESSVLPEHRGYLEAWRAFKRDTGFVAEHIEEPRYHAIYRYAGTPDRVGYLREKVNCAIVDLKTGDVQPAAQWQLAAYANLYEIPPRFKRLAVRLKSDGKYSVTEYLRPVLGSDFNVFTSALAIWYVKQEHGL